MLELEVALEEETGARKEAEKKLQKVTTQRDQARGVGRALVWQRTHTVERLTRLRACSC